jgi:hypothetical protein
MKNKVTRRTTLKALAASAVAGGAWLTNLVVPEFLARAAAPKLPKGAEATVKKLAGADLSIAVSTFMSSTEGKALSSHLQATGRAPMHQLASAIQWEYAGQSRIGVVIPHGSDGSQIGAFGIDLSSPESAGSSQVEQLTHDFMRATTYEASTGSALATHQYLADRPSQRIKIVELSTGRTRTVTHADVERSVQALQQPRGTAGILGFAGPTAAEASVCGLCVFLAGAFASLGGCGAAAWLACLVFFWDPPAAAACAALVAIWGTAVLFWICWALGLGFGANYGCYVIGFCSCPFPWC